MSSLVSGQIMTCRNGEVGRYSSSWALGLGLTKWTDKQLLVHEETAQIISNAIAVATTLALPRLLILLQAALPFVLDVSRYLSQPFRGWLRRQPSRLSSHILETFRDANSITTVASRLTQRHLGMHHITLDKDHRHDQRRWRNIYANFQEDKLIFSIICLGILSLGASYLGIQAVAILTTGILSDVFALSNSTNCGWWVPPTLHISNISSGVPAFVLPSETHFETVNYALRICGPLSFSSAGPGFVDHRIKYQKDSNAPCPFNEIHCASNSSAFLMDTGYQSSKILGINTAKENLFRMQVVCSPLKSQPSIGATPAKVDKISRDYAPTGNNSTGTYVVEGMGLNYRAHPGDAYDEMRITLSENSKDEQYLFKWLNVKNKAFSDPGN